ncbi:MAG: iron-containing redox enzyme family protein [Candidatus Binatia bacterium]
MGTQSFVDSVVREIIQPGVQGLMDSRYFLELREGKLSTRRLRGWALQHYLHNVALCKGFALCMAKHAHDPFLYDYFSKQLREEQPHPELAKQFGLALGLTEEDFDNAVPVYECLAHTSAVIRTMFLGSPEENRASALVNESMVLRYSGEFNNYLRKHYGLNDEALEFFTVHAVADKEHTVQAARVMERYASTPLKQCLARETAHHMVRFKLGKFDGIYKEYA